MRGRIAPPIDVFRLARLVVDFTWLALAGLMLAVVVIGHGASILGYRTVVVRGPSMEPTIPLGALALETAPDPAGAEVGDVITFSGPSGVAVTHRVVRVVPGAAPAVVTRGDANLVEDPLPVSQSAISGVVAAWVPFAGFAIAWMQLPTGLTSVVSMLGALIVAARLLDEEEPITGYPSGVEDLTPAGAG